DFVRSVEHIDISHRTEFREAGRTCLITRKEDIPVFDQVFDTYWQSRPDFTDDFYSGAETSDQLSDMIEGEDIEAEADGSTEDEGGERLRRSEAVESEEGSDHAEDSDGESDEVLSYSAAEVLHERDFADLTDDEL